MQEKINNQVEIIGEITSEFTFNHRVYGENFYSFTLKVRRLSESADGIVITLSERLIFNENFKIGDIVQIHGQYRSYNNYNTAGNRLILTVFARTIERVTPAYNTSTNSIFLNGFICKPPIFRTTPFGREIADTLLAVNRTYNKSDYIPCIAWGRNARFISELSVGTNLLIWGRIQSREYEKKLNNDEIVIKTAYEVSVNKIEIIENNKSESKT
ncbi:single-stranded DNA-binding protein [Clostridia bacterium]|nr:single-stranded DNA-binding protein [Clostridia bacterium]